MLYFILERCDFFLDNACVNYEEPLMLPGVVDDISFVEECSFLPGILEEFTNKKITPESINAIESEAVIVDENSYSSNCLALTIVPDYKMLSVKNVITQSVRITYKILFSTIVLNIIKLFC